MSKSVKNLIFSQRLIMSRRIALLNVLKMYGFKNDCNVFICYVLNNDGCIIITIPFFFADWLPEAISQSSLIDAKTWFGHRNK